jgi:formylmethanofuran dehydrogenase subunit D
VTERLTLITGRTRKQGIGLHKGKRSAEYRAATEIIEMNPEDMARIGIVEGGRARVHTAAGEVDLTAHEGSLPPGLAFVPMGTTVNAIIGTETLGTGMPSFKGLTVEVTAVGPAAVEAAPAGATPADESAEAGDET